MSNRAYILDGQLRPCKKGFNCVSTNPESKKSRIIQPFRFKKEIYTAALKEMIIKFVKSTYPATVLKYGESYIHFEIRTNVLNLKSDMEILMIPEKKEVHFRSCSRSAFWDLGSNNRRVNKIKKFLNKQLQSRDANDN